MTVKGGSNQACAACKYQRRRCKPDCQLAPYFRPNQSKQFLNVHRLFGLRNLLRILKYLHPSQKSEAMRSIIYEADMRQRYPVLGCVGAIQILQFQIQQAQKEFQFIDSYLEAYRRYYHHQQLQLKDLDAYRRYYHHQQLPLKAPSSPQFQLVSPNTCQNSPVSRAGCF